MYKDTLVYFEYLYQSLFLNDYNSAFIGGMDKGLINITHMLNYLGDINHIFLILYREPLCKNHDSKQ